MTGAAADCSGPLGSAGEEGGPGASMEALRQSGGTMGALVLDFDWSQTPLGHIARWPRSLQTAVSICLTSRHPLWVGWGPELILIYNDAFRPVLRDKHPASLGRPVLDEVWPEVASIIGPMLQGVMGGAEATWQDDQLLLLERNGQLEETYFTYSYSPLYDDDGRIGGVFTAVSETTERVLGERRLGTLRELADATATARTAAEVCTSAADVMRRNAADLPLALLYLVDNDGLRTRLVASSGAPDGWSPQDTIDLRAPGGGGPLGMVSVTGETLHVPDLRGLAALPRPPLSDGPQAALVLPLTQAAQARPAGMLVAALNPRRPLDDAYRGFVGLVAAQVATAIANATAYEAEARRADALAELDRAKTAFFSNVSHEFRTPITLLLGPLEDLIADPGAPAEVQRERADMAHRNALRLLKHANALLDFSRMEAGRLRPRLEPVELGAATAELASAFQSAMEQAGLELRVDCPALPRPVRVDRQMWETVVLNLLSNAFKFTLQGSVDVVVRDAGENAEMAIADTGVGIPAAEIAHVFDRFHRVPGTRARTQEGAGIGLALARELVQLLGGAIEVSSRERQGTTFTVTLPYATDQLPADRVQAATVQPRPPMGALPYVAEAMRWLPDGAPPHGGLGVEVQRNVESADSSGGESPGATAGARVLVADDNADMRDHLARILGRHWTVEVVPNGAAALAVARHDPPAMVVTDAMMPEMDGFELLGELRRDPRTAHVPVVMLSARAGEEATVEGLDAGADDYLIKPFSARELVARVRSTLELTRARTAAREATVRAQGAIGSLQRAVASLAAVAQHIDAVADHPPAFFAGLTRTVAELVGARMVAFWSLRDDGTLAMEEGSFGVDPEVATRMRGVPCRPQGQGLVEQVVFGGLVFRASALDDREEVAPYRAWLEALQVSNAVARAWEAGTRKLGLLAAYDSERPEGFTEEDAWVLWIASLGAGLVWQFRQAEGQRLAARQKETDRLRQHGRRMSELERVKGGFLNLAAHELRGPLTVARGYVTMLSDGSLGPALRPEAARLLPIVAGKLADMNDLVDRMLETARLEEQRVDLAEAELDLAQLVRDAVAATAPSTPSSHRILVDAEPGPVVVRGDRERLATVLTNLLDNAVKYSPAGGDVVVSCSTQVVPGLVHVTVRDRGLGIAPAHLPLLFTRFGRIVTPENSHIAGVGLGLFLCREVVVLHGGELWVDSTSGEGTTFTMVLPLASLDQSWPPGAAVEGQHVAQRFDLPRLDSSSLVRCAAHIRATARGADGLDEAATRTVRLLYDGLVDGAGDRACALVRYFVTRRYGDLEPDLRLIARQGADDQLLTANTRCLCLLASAGDLDDWNSPVTSRRHRVIPVPSREALRQSPMLAQLFSQFGIDIDAVGPVDPSLTVAEAIGASSVFHVAEAQGSPHVPDQPGFVIPHRIASVVGFGGVRAGELCAVILFSRMQIDRQLAGRFRSLALALCSAREEFVDLRR